MIQESNETQAELFKEFAKAPKKRPWRRLWLPRGLTVKVSHESLILGVILLIMVMILCFTFGVERGKRIGAIKASARRDAKNIEEGGVAPMTVPMREEEGISVNQEVIPLVQEVETKAEEERLEAYAIQLITYKHEEYANKELAKLKRNGFEPFVVRSGRFFVVNIGPYKNKDEALTILKEFKRQAPYRSAFLRKLSQ